MQVPIDKGTVLLAVYGSKADFDENENAVLAKEIPVDRVGEYTVSLEGLAAGSYTIALFQDINNNGKLDTNFMGIPKEPYAFSRNPKVKWRAPRYQEVVFDLKASTEMNVKLKKWSKR
jgi:uncharacterized protein (DUF2141 family)